MAKRRNGKAPDAGTSEAQKATRKSAHGNANKNKTQSVTALRLALLANVYEPIPIKDKSKRSGLEDWTNIVATKEIIQGWERFPGTGVLTRKNPTIDIDILDEDVAKDLEEFTRGFFNGK